MPRTRIFHELGGMQFGTVTEMISYLGLGTMSTYSSSAVNITGGNISGVSPLASTNVALSGGQINNVPVGVSAASTGRFSSLAASSNLILPKSQAEGIQTETTAATFPWHDLLGEIQINTTSASSAVPNWVVYRGNIRQYQFSTGDIATNTFHVPHDYLPGSVIYLHIHWSHNLTTISSTGTVTWEFEVTYSKGHNQAAFSTPVTVSVVATGSTVQYQHIITEIAISGSAGSTSTIPTTDLEVDGLMIVNTRLTATTLTGAALPYAHYVDVHYQSRGLGTKQKAPNFYV